MDAAVAGEEVLEHERRFLPKMNELPFDFYHYPMSFIIQGYTDIKPRMRLRNEYRNGGHIYTKTQKTGKGISRPEKEVVITKIEFDLLWKDVKHSLAKSRYYIPWRGIEAQLNIYHDELARYAQLEVEFPTEEGALMFEPPYWFGPEVTHDKRHNNRFLATFGAPR